MPETPPSSRATTSAANGAEHFIELLRTLADPIRMRMLRLLEAQPHNGSGHASGNSGGGLSVGELGEVLKLPQSTVSRHLKTLTDAHLAEARREGTSMLYRLSDEATHNASKQLRTLARAHLDQDPTAKTDSQRLAAVLRKREPDKSGDTFGKHAPHWDHLRAQWFGDTFHLEGMLALLNPTWTVADVGTGTGAMLPLLSPHVSRVIAIDPSPAMLKGAKGRMRELGLENVECRQGAAENLPVEDGSVDVVLLALVLAYTADPKVVLKEIRRVLKPGGILLIIDLQPHSIELFRQKLNHRWMGFPRNQLTDWAAEAGFVQVRWHPLAAKHARAKETPIPDLFTLRAERPKQRNDA